MSFPNKIFEFRLWNSTKSKQVWLLLISNLLFRWNTSAIAMPQIFIARKSKYFKTVSTGTPMARCIQNCRRETIQSQSDSETEKVLLLLREIISSSEKRVSLN